MESSILRVAFSLDSYSVNTLECHTLHSPPNIACMSDMNPRGELRVHALDYREGSERCHHLRVLRVWEGGGGGEITILGLSSIFVSNA